VRSACWTALLLRATHTRAGQARQSAAWHRVRSQTHPLPALSRGACNAACSLELYASARPTGEHGERSTAQAPCAGWRCRPAASSSCAKQALPRAQPNHAFACPPTGAPQPAAMGAPAAAAAAAAQGHPPGMRPPPMSAMVSRSDAVLGPRCRPTAGSVVQVASCSCCSAPAAAQPGHIAGRPGALFQHAPPCLPLLHDAGAADGGAAPPPAPAGRTPHAPLHPPAAAYRASSSSSGGGSGGSSSSSSSSSSRAGPATAPARWATAQLAASRPRSAWSGSRAAAGSARRPAGPQAQAAPGRRAPGRGGAGAQQQQQEAAAGARPGQLGAAAGAPGWQPARLRQHPAWQLPREPCTACSAHLPCNSRVICSGRGSGRTLDYDLAGKACERLLLSPRILPPLPPQLNPTQPPTLPPQYTIMDLPNMALRMVPVQATCLDFHPQIPTSLLVGASAAGPSKHSTCQGGPLKARQALGCAAHLQHRRATPGAGPAEWLRGRRRVPGAGGHAQGHRRVVVAGQHGARGGAAPAAAAAAGGASHARGVGARRHGHRCAGPPPSSAHCPLPTALWNGHVLGGAQVSHRHRMLPMRCRPAAPWPLPRPRRPSCAPPPALTRHPAPPRPSQRWATPPAAGAATCSCTRRHRAAASGSRAWSWRPTRATCATWCLWRPASSCCWSRAGTTATCASGTRALERPSRACTHVSGPVAGCGTGALRVWVPPASSMAVPLALLPLPCHGATGTAAAASLPPSPPLTSPVQCTGRLRCACARCSRRRPTTTARSWCCLAAWMGASSSLCRWSAAACCMPTCAPPAGARLGGGTCPASAGQRGARCPACAQLANVPSLAPRLRGALFARFASPRHPPTLHPTPPHPPTPARCCTNVLYCQDRARLFSCGAGDGEGTLVEWSEEDGQVLTRFAGFANKAEASLRMAIAGGRFLLVPDDGVIKVGGAGGGGGCL
jgi:hypothetical protein